MKHEDEFETFVRRSRARLLGTATALTAGDTFLAEDLVQGTLVRMYVRWRRTSFDNVEAYARRALVNAFIDHGRRTFVQRERTVALVPDTDRVRSDEATDHADLLAALAALPPRMRAAVVLRYVEDLSVEDTAAELACTRGTVKSQTARGIAKLRETLANRRDVVIATTQGDPS